jgi:hypothetical protein
MWRRLGLVRTEIYEELVAAIFNERGSSETSVLKRPTLHHIPVDGILLQVFYSFRIKDFGQTHEQSYYYMDISLLCCQKSDLTHLQILKRI